MQIYFVEKRGAKSALWDQKPDQDKEVQVETRKEGK
jgi:hypothetical protein